MNEQLDKTLAGLLFNEKALDYFVSMEMRDLMFFKPSPDLNAKYGSRDHRMLAFLSIKFFKLYNELPKWGWFIKNKNVMKKSDLEMAAIKNLYDKCLSLHSDQSYGEWRCELKDMVDKFRVYRNKEIMSMAGDLYQKECLNQYDVTSSICKSCLNKKECKVMQKSKQEDRTSWILDWQARQFEIIKQQSGGSIVRQYKVKDLMLGALNEYEGYVDNYQEDGPPIMGLPVPLKCMADQMVGWLPGRLYGITARTSVGKSAFLLQSSNHVSMHGHPALYFNLEMGTKEELIHRIIAYMCNVDFGALMSKNISPQMYEYIQKKLKYYIKNMGEDYEIIDVPKRSKIELIMSLTDKFIARHGRNILHVVDHFGLLWWDDTMKKHDALEILAQEYHDYIKKNNIPSLTALQSNRSADGGKVKTAAGVRGSDAIPDSFDMLWQFHGIGDMIRVDTIKGRYAAKKYFYLIKDLKHMRFKEKDDDPAPSIPDEFMDSEVTGNDDDDIAELIENE